MSRWFYFSLTAIALFVVALWFKTSVFQWVILWTDSLIFVTFTAIFAFAVYTRRKPHLLRRWFAVFKTRMGVVTALILVVYCFVGALDSIHFRTPATQVISLLDIILQPLKEHTEKSYSAPFSAYLYVKDTVELSTGEKIRTFPRLKYGGAHLTEPDTEIFADILWRFSVGFFQGLCCWLFVMLGIAWYLARKKNQTVRRAVLMFVDGTSTIPWKSLLLTVGIIFVLIGLVSSLGSYYHIFGTDRVGQDVLYMTLKSIRTGLVIGSLSTLIMLPFAISLGMMAGYFRGWVDDVIQYIYTTLNAIPGVLLIAAAILMVQVNIETQPVSFSTEERADLRLLSLCVILGITSWTGLCRLLRGETLKLREQEYIQAAQAFGVGAFTIMWRHILPNIMHVVLITVVLDFSGLVLAEAVLSYVGVGVDPTMHSWGNMINVARLEMAREPIVWWSLLAAFGFMFILVLAANLFADAVRCAFDPRLQQH